MNFYIHLLSIGLMGSGLLHSCCSCRTVLTDRILSISLPTSGGLHIVWLHAIEVEMDEIFTDTALPPFRDAGEWGALDPRVSSLSKFGVTQSQGFSNLLAFEQLSDTLIASWNLNKTTILGKWVKLVQSWISKTCNSKCQDSHSISLIFRSVLMPARDWDMSCFAIRYI